MKQAIVLTPSELEIMEAIWELGESPSVREVVEHAYPAGEKAYTTVQTVMNKLVNKGVLESKKIGLVNFYTPRHSRSQLVRDETARLMGRFFNGSIPALANYLLDLNDLDLKDIEQMKRLLQEKENEIREAHNGTAG